MGELQVRGPWVISQYFKREVTEDYMTRDGWFRTGDVVTIRPEGYIHIRDRTKDLIKSGGEWISTVDLEGRLWPIPRSWKRRSLPSRMRSGWNAPGRGCACAWRRAAGRSGS